MLNDLRRIAKSALLSAIPSPWKRQDILRVAIQTTDGFDAPLWTGALDRQLPDWRDRIELLCVPGDFAFAHAASDADACTTMTLTPALFGHARLKWINGIPAGVNLAELPAPPAGLSVTTSRGIAARSMAEHALMLLLALRRQLPATLQSQQQWTWSQVGLLDPLPDLSELTVAVFGLGAAGSEAARLCKALGMHVIGVRRSAENPHEHCDEICALADFFPVLPRADAVILTLPLSNATRELFAEKEFAQMKPGALLVNVARGGLIREDQLAAALREPRLGGAGLDVLSAEPPARDSALKDCPNLIVTPHLAGNLHRFRPAIAARFARNLDAFLAGRPLEGLLPHDHWPAPPNDR